MTLNALPQAAVFLIRIPLPRTSPNQETTSDLTSPNSLTQHAIAANMIIYPFSSDNHCNYHKPLGESTRRSKHDKRHSTTKQQ